MLSWVSPFNPSQTHRNNPNSVQHLSGGCQDVIAAPRAACAPVRWSLAPASVRACWLMSAISARRRRSGRHHGADRQHVNESPASANSPALSCLPGLPPQPAGWHTEPQCRTWRGSGARPGRQWRHSAAHKVRCTDAPSPYNYTYTATTVHRPGHRVTGRTSAPRQ